MPNFARACGRVSIGGHPDKRPDSRPERDRNDRKIIGSSELRTLDWQPEAKPAHLVLHEGRGLKQRRGGLFWSLPVLHQPARATEEACSSLPRVRIGDIPNPIQGSIAGFRALSLTRPHRASSGARRPASYRAVRRSLAYGESAMTERIHEFLRCRNEDGPCLVVDLEVVRENYGVFANALPDTRVFYAVKANPA